MSRHRMLQNLHYAAELADKEFELCRRALSDPALIPVAEYSSPQNVPDMEIGSKIWPEADPGLQPISAATPDAGADVQKHS